MKAIVFPATSLRDKSVQPVNRRVEKLILKLGIIGFALFASAAASAAADFSSLRSQLTDAVADPRFKHAQLGMKVVSLTDNSTIFDHDGEKLLKPASNAKLFAGALALDVLKPDTRIQTSAYTANKPDAAGRIGDLIIYGRGDPSFANRFYGDFRKPLAAIAKAIHKAGVKAVSGDLIADESFFNTSGYGAGWTWEDLMYRYGAAISALSINDNYARVIISPGPVGQPGMIRTSPAATPFEIINRTVTTADRGALLKWRPYLGNRMQITGSLMRDGSSREFRVTVKRPAVWFVQLLRIELEKLGIKVTGRARAINWHERLLDPIPKNLHHLGSMPSPTILRITQSMMKDSQNLYAQLLLLQVGARHRLKGESTDAAGIAQLKAFCRRAGIPDAEMQLEEGSGLSRAGLVTPNAVVQLLRHMQNHEHARAFESTLAVAGVDGTLTRRFRGTKATNNLRGKTGTINFVNALSGYVTNQSGKRLAFSIMLNAYPGDDGRASVDRIALLLANSK